MSSEELETPNGWPLGLENMNLRIRIVESVSTAAESYPLHRASTSFSSFSSSNLDTESTASFFQDNSVSLGRLIGIRPGERRGLYFPNARFEEHENVSVRVSKLDVSVGDKADLPQGLCIPLLLGILEKMNRTKSSSKSSTF